MAAKTTGCFVGSRFGSFVASPLHQRIESGVGVVEYVTLKRSVSAIQGKWGFVFPVVTGPLGDFTPFANDDERVDFLTQTAETSSPPVPIGARSEVDAYWSTVVTFGCSVYRDDWAFGTATITTRSTPDPGTSTGYFETEVVHNTRAKSGYLHAPSASSSGTGPDHFNIFGVGWSAGTRTITYSESGIVAYKTWTDGSNVVEITIEYSNPISNDDVIEWVQEVWAGKTKSLDSVADGQDWAAYYWGASDTLTESSTAPFGTGAFSFDYVNTPLTLGGGESSGSSVASGVDGPWFYDYPIQMRDAEFAVKGQHADYTYRHEFDTDFISNDSEKLPYYPSEVRLRYLANAEHWDDDTLTQKRPHVLTYFDTVSPFPDFPDPEA